MGACFQNKPALRPFICLPNTVPLAQLNPPKSALAPAVRRLAEQSERLDFDNPDRADEETLNRILWHAARGMNARFPVHVPGGDGTGRR
jgi:hypothetical protein